MRILADTNVPEEYVFALRGDGHQVKYSRDVTQLGPEATDAEITEYAEVNDFAVLSTDVKDFGDRDAGIPILVAPQDMTGGSVRSAVASLEALPLDASESEPLWLTGLL